jgi:hypothetical protein
LPGFGEVDLVIDLPRIKISGGDPPIYTRRADTSGIRLNIFPALARRR